jgi:hypothetical protein
MFWPLALVKVDFFDEADGSFALPLLVADSPLAFWTTVEPACGVVGAAFEKNPRIDRWFLLDAALEFCFFRDGGGRAGVSAILSPVFAILEVNSKSNESLMKFATGRTERVLCHKRNRV